MNLKIYTIHHFIPEWYLNNDVFIPFIVDAFTAAPIHPPFQTDANLPVSFRQHSFAEMRCHYWHYSFYYEWYSPINAPNYVGFFHYRRKLMTWHPWIIDPFKRTSIETFKTGNYLETTIFLDLCDNHDIILPRPWRMLPDLAENYCRAHRREDWEALIQALPEDYPKEGFGDLLWPCNIFIMRSDIFAEYMAWWEKIMIDLMKVISPPPPPEYQSRSFGFISDRMFTIWLKHQRERHPEWRILELPMLIGDFSSI